MSNTQTEAAFYKEDIKQNGHCVINSIALYVYS